MKNKKWDLENPKNPIPVGSDLLDSYTEAQRYLTKYLILSAGRKIW